jgi:hypothetical protein
MISRTSSARFGGRIAAFKPDLHAIPKFRGCLPRHANRRSYGKEQRHTIRNVMAQRALHGGYEPNRDFVKAQAAPRAQLCLDCAPSGLRHYQE